MHFPSPTLNIRTSRCEVASELPGGGIALEAPKTARGRRKVQLPPFVVEALRQLKTEQNKLRLILGEDWATGNFVFTGPSTTSIKPLVRDEAGGPTADVRRSIYGVPVYLTSQLSIVEAQGSGTNLSRVRTCMRPKRSSPSCGRTSASTSIAHGCSTPIRLRLVELPCGTTRAVRQSDGMHDVDRPDVDGLHQDRPSVPSGHPHFRICL